MDEKRKTQKEIGEDPKAEDKDEKVEGYTFCASMKTKCLTDCLGGTPFISEIN